MTTVLYLCIYSELGACSGNNNNFLNQLQATNVQMYSYDTEIKSYRMLSIRVSCVSKLTNSYWIEKYCHYFPHVIYYAQTARST